ncbi:MAG: hypothetical protein Q8N52_05365 [Acidobacteriota bacterium]|nr:hypothetical protein [Acidobacteriota bacterium]
MRRPIAPALSLVALLAARPALAQDASTDYTLPHQRKALEIYRTIIGFRTAAGHGRLRPCPRP